MQMVAEYVLLPDIQSALDKTNEELGIMKTNKAAFERQINMIEGHQGSISWTAMEYHINTLNTSIRELNKASTKLTQVYNANVLD